MVLTVVMGDEIWPHALWGRVRDGRMLALLWILTAVPPPALPQPPLPLSLPVQMSVVPPPWRYVPLSRAELGPLFSNSSPFSFSQSLLLVPPAGQASGAKPGIRASFGPYSVTQLISEAVVPLSPPPLLASLLSGGVVRERGEGGEERYRVRALFHARANGSGTGATCITLHAFKDTQEHKASCVTQPPLGLCMVTLTLPRDWFESDLLDQSNWGSEDQRIRQSVNNQRHRAPNRQSQRRGSWHGNAGDGGWRGDNDRTTGGAGNTAPLRQQPGLAGAEGGAHRGGAHRGGAHIGGAHGGGALRYLRGPMGSHIQLYYSSFSPVSNLKQAAPRCVEERPLSQRELFNIGVVTLREEEQGQEKDHTARRRNSTKEEEACLKGREEEELILDPHVLIRYHRGPVWAGQTVGVSVNLRANFSSEFVVIRLKVKKGLVSMLAQRTLTSDLWVVTLDRSHASKHDIISIICHKRGLLNHSVLQQVACLSVDGLRRSFGVAMTVTANWWVEYSGRNNVHSPHGAAVSTFSFADRHIVGIAPLTESNTIINTAILTGEHVSLPVIALAVAHDGQVSDVTTVVRCRSTNEDIIKVSSDCSTLFVDGSESGTGSTCARVEFHLGTLSGSVCVSVWAPSVPLRVSLSDPVLNAIVGWNHLTENGCSPLFQRSTVQVLTQFTAQDARGDTTTHLLGSSDWFVDVTELLHRWLRVENRQVAVLGERGTVIGLRPGRTSLHVISEQWDGVLGSCDITVSPEAVTLGDLSVQVVGGLGMSVKANPAHPAVVTTTVTAYNVLYEYGQEASISAWLQFSDDTSSLLSSFDGLPFSLRLSSLAESVVAVTPGRVQRVVAQGDGGGPLLRAELLVRACVDPPPPPLASNSIFDGGDDRPPSTRRLARGSGWIRVNLDSDFLRPMGGGSEDGDGEDFEYDFSDMLVEPDGGVSYAANFDGDNATGDEYRGRAATAAGNSGGAKQRGAVAAQSNDLERAALMPNPEESDVYFSPSLERGGGGGGGGGRRDMERELEVGAGVVLSLLCLSTVLFLANCLPCAVRERRRRRKATLDGGKEEAGRRGGTEEGEEEEEWPRRKVEVKGRVEERREEEGHEKQGEETTEGVKAEGVGEVEIVC